MSKKRKLETVRHPSPGGRERGRGAAQQWIIEEGKPRFPKMSNIPKHQRRGGSRRGTCNFIRRTRDFHHLDKSSMARRICPLSEEEDESNVRDGRS
ncbi:hypothetical protein PVAP13_1KG276705 [Panicum virgatum]|uniref:Uncharacterized protein n=1 Tax=Panicum virgatum TaxID=38727 RepID=A0A8T0XLL1_PANVG|nr:hypothetical protein PVAP13_1KG276705 [Panicum virgatum]